MIRQAVMCKADTALATFTWKDGETKPMLNLESPEHTCVDWDDLMEQMKPRVISGDEMDKLHPPDIDGM
jgi:hypothetical protein